MADSFTIDLPASQTSTQSVRFYMLVEFKMCELCGAVFDTDVLRTVSVWIDFRATAEDLGWSDYTYANVESLIIGAIITYYLSVGWQLVSHSTAQPQDDSYLVSFVFVRRRN